MNFAAAMRVWRRGRRHRPLAHLIRDGCDLTPGAPQAEPSGCRSTIRRSIARLVPQPGQKASSQGAPAISAARMVGDHSRGQ
jgi:hypothetical protein